MKLYNTKVHQGNVKPVRDRVDPRGIIVITSLDSVRLEKAGTLRYLMWEGFSVCNLCRTWPIKIWRASSESPWHKQLTATTLITIRQLFRHSGPPPTHITNAQKTPYSQLCRQTAFFLSRTVYRWCSVCVWETQTEKVILRTCKYFSLQPLRSSSTMLHHSHYWARYYPYVQTLIYVGCTKHGVFG